MCWHGWNRSEEVKEQQCQRVVIVNGSDGSIRLSGGGVTPAEERRLEAVLKERGAGQALCEAQVACSGRAGQRRRAWDRKVVLVNIQLASYSKEGIVADLFWTKGKGTESRED